MTVVTSPHRRIAGQVGEVGHEGPDVQPVAEARAVRGQHPRDDLEDPLGLGDRERRAGRGGPGIRAAKRAICDDRQGNICNHPERTATEIVSGSAKIRAIRAVLATGFSAAPLPQRPDPRRRCRAVRAGRSLDTQP